MRAQVRALRAEADAGASTKTKNNEGETPLALAPDSFCAAVLDRDT